MFSMHFSFCRFFIATAILPIVINWRLIAKQTSYYFYITVSCKNWLCLPTPNQPAASPPTKPLLPEKFLLILFTNYEHLNVQTCLLPFLFKVGTNRCLEIYIISWSLCDEISDRSVTGISFFIVQEMIVIKKKLY